MAIASFPWQRQYAIVSGGGDSEIQKTRLRFRVKCPVFLSDFNEN
jgi:hypothetical protein